MTGSWTPVDPRALSPWEAAILARLAPDADHDAIGRVQVIDRCDCGCSSVGFSHVPHFPVAEAEAADEDGELVWVMLFAGDDGGTLATLDVLRADGRPLRKRPDPGDLTILSTSPWAG
jgi:hypothetical protein